MTLANSTTFPPPLDTVFDWSLSDLVYASTATLLMPGQQPPYTQLYEQYVNGYFIFDFHATDYAGARLLLDTDLNPATGTTFYGTVNESLEKGLPNNQYVLASGIDYQVTFAADGTPQLLTGSGVLVGTLPFAIVAGCVEFALPLSLMANTPQAISLQIEFYGGAYGVEYVPQSFVVAPPLQVGGITIDGQSGDWTAADRLDSPANGVPGYALYGKSAGDYDVFAIQAPVAIGANTTMWINTDGNTQTGYLIWGFAGGAEYNVNFDANGVPHLYTGGAGETLVSADLPWAISADGQFVEFAVPKALIGSPAQIGTYFDVNDTVFLPTLYVAGAYTIGDTPPAPVLSAASDSGVSATDDITNVTTPTLTGTASAGAVVNLFEGSTLLGSATAAGDGSWSIVSAILGDGTHTLFTTATYADGTTGLPSATLAVTIDTKAPAAPVFTALTKAANGSAMLTGTGEAGSGVSVFDGAAQIGTATVSAGGTWSFVTAAALADRKHVFTAKATDAAGNTSGTVGSAQLGSSGADTLSSTPGNDILAGGRGADVFSFRAGFGRDVITDFTASGAGHDTIALHGIAGLNSFAQVLSHAKQVGTGVVISADANDTLTLSNVTKSSLVSHDFAFT